MWNYPRSLSLLKACWFLLIFAGLQTAVADRCQGGEFERAMDRAHRVPAGATDKRVAAWSSIVARFPDHPSVDEARFRWAQAIEGDDRSSGATDEAAQLYTEIIAHEGVTGKFGRNAVAAFIHNQLIAKPEGLKYYQSISFADEFLAAVNANPFQYRWVDILKITSLRAEVLYRVGRRAEAIRSQADLLHQFQDRIQKLDGTERFEQDVVRPCDNPRLEFQYAALTLGSLIGRNARTNQPPVPISNVDKLRKIDSPLANSLQRVYPTSTPQPFIVSKAFVATASAWLALALVCAYFGRHQASPTRS